MHLLVHAVLDRITIMFFSCFDVMFYIANFDLWKIMIRSFNACYSLATYIELLNFEFHFLYFSLINNEKYGEAVKIMIGQNNDKC